MNFFPVIGEDENGEMVELDAKKVLSIPRKLKSREVVRRGFMSDFLFRNISNIFHAPQAVLDILQTMEAVKEPQRPLEMNPNAAADLSINDEGEVELDQEYVIGQANTLFGDKIFDTEKAAKQVDDILKAAALSAAATRKEEDKILDKLNDTFHRTITAAILNEAQEQYGRDLSKSSRKQLERKINAETDAVVNKVYGDFRIQQNTLEAEWSERVAAAETHEERQRIDQEIEEKKQQAMEVLKQAISDSVEDFIKSSGETVVKTAETEKREEKKLISE